MWMHSLLNMILHQILYSVMKLHQRSWTQLTKKSVVYLFQTLDFDSSGLGTLPLRGKAHAR